LPEVQTLVEKSRISGAALRPSKSGHRFGRGPSFRVAGDRSAALRHAVDWTAVQSLSAGMRISAPSAHFQNKILPDGTLDDRASPETPSIRREIEKQKHYYKIIARILRKLAEVNGSDS